MTEHRAEWLQPQTFILRVLEAAEFKVKVQADLVSGERLYSSLQAEAFSLYPDMATRDHL